MFVDDIFHIIISFVAELGQTLLSEDVTWKEIERTWLEVHEFDSFWKIFVAQYFVIRLLLKRFLQSVFTVVLVGTCVYLYVL